MTTSFTDARDPVIATEGVYAPQQDSRLLVSAMEDTGLTLARRVADLCCSRDGSGCGATDYVRSSAVARAKWFERMGWLPTGRRDERIVVIRADKP